MTETLKLKGICEAEIDENDILLGRGGKTNHHPGNASYLKLIEARQVEYMFLESRTEKTDYAMAFVQQLRKEGTRFLKKDDKDGKSWSDVGDLKMREKVSQNLREHQPKLKKQLAEKQRLEHQQKQQQQQQRLSKESLAPPLQQQACAQMMPPIHVNSMQQRPLVDHQQLMQQQQLWQAMAQQNLMQTQQQFQLLQQQQQCMGNNNNNNSQFPNYPNQMMAPGGASIMAGSMMGGMPNNIPFNNEITTATATATAAAQWNNTSDQQGLLDNVLDNLDAQNQQSLSSLSALPENVESFSSLSALPENVGSSLLTQEQEQFAQGERAFSKQQVFANRDHDNFQSSGTLPEENEDDGDMPLHNIAKPSLASRVATLTDIDVLVAMGESNHSMLESLHIHQVPEEGEGEEGDQLSPKPNMVTINGVDQLTPVLNDKQNVAAPPFGIVNPVTVTPTPNSPKQPKASGNACVLDNDILQAWANTADDDDEDEFALGGAEDILGGVPPAAAPFRRSKTNPDSKPSAEAAPYRRQVTAPATTPDPFRTTSPHSPRRHHDGAGTSPKPGALTMSKRATSNVNETPETRGGLQYQECPLGDDMNDSFNNDPSSSYSKSSFSSVKKASLGRDKSAQSRLLKQQYMPHAFGQSGSFSTASTASTNGTMGSAISNDWANSATLSPTPNSDDNSPPPGQGGTTKTITPKTQSVLTDFGKMTLTQAAEKGLSPNHILARTAEKFEDTIANQDPADAAQIPMELMMNKPLPLLWQNRSNTIDALDLDCLEDDTVLQEERKEKNSNGESGGVAKRRVSRSSMNSIAGMWANMPSSEDFEALVCDIAGQKVTDLGMEQPKQAKTPAKLALPNLKA